MTHMPTFLIVKRIILVALWISVLLPPTESVAQLRKPLERQKKLLPPPHRVTPQPTFPSGGPLPSIIYREVGVMNVTNVPLFFWLRPFYGQWRVFQLQPGQWSNYNNADNISVSSNEDSGYPIVISYLLAPGHNYILVDNFEGGYFDVISDD